MSNEKNIDKNAQRIKIAKAKAKAQFVRVKKHFAENKETYIAGGVCVIANVGAVLASAALTKKGDELMMDSMSSNNTNAPRATAVFGDANLHNHNEIHIQMVRPGPKSYVVQCEETQEVFPSIRQAAEAMGISASAISGHLSGKLDHAGNYTFTKLDEV